MYRKYLKRPMDIALSLTALIILSPVLLITALLVRIKLGHPVILRQPRPGKDEKIFTLYKFRTMTNETDEAGKLLPDEYRFTAFGNKLRSSSIDELPELFNILKGDMSIIGPRPLAEKYLPYYTKEESRRHSVKPGLSGWAQVNGRSTVIWEERFQLDLYYVDNISLILDWKIIFMSLYKAVSRKDVLPDNNALTDFHKYRTAQQYNRDELNL